MDRSVLEIAEWNAIITTVCSVASNLLLLFCIVKSSNQEGKRFQALLISQNISRIFTSIIFCICVPTLHVRTNGLLVINNGPITDFICGKIFVVLYIALFALSTTELPIQFIYRYLLICRPGYFVSNERKVFLILRLIGYILVTIWTTLFFVSDVIDGDSDLEDEQGTIVGERTFVQITFTETNFLFGADLLFLCFLLLLGTVIAVVCARRVMKTLQNGLISDKGLDLHKQLFRCLLLQTVVPIITTHIPVFVAIILPFYQVYPLDSFADILIIPFAWYPVIDPLIVFIAVKSYRKVIPKLCSSRHELRSSSGPKVGPMSPVFEKRQSMYH